MCLFAEACVPYSVAACKAAADKLGLVKGGLGSNFQGANHDTKGCYAYDSGDYKGHVYYGTGDLGKMKRKHLYYSKYRPQGYDCAAHGATGNLNDHTLM